MKNAQGRQGFFHSMALNQADSASGDNSSFEAQFHEHWAHVYRALLRLVGDPAEAEDLALEAFLRLYRIPAGQGSAPGFNAGGWLHRVATNLGLNSIRSHRRRVQYELAAGRGALENPSGWQPAQELEEMEQRREARKALAAMNPRQAELLVLRHSGASYREIAAALGVAPASIGPLLVRAERTFEKLYRAENAEET